MEHMPGLVEPLPAPLDPVDPSWPPPSGRRAIMRVRSHHVIIDGYFARNGYWAGTAAHRNLYRWLYRQFRRNPHATAASARALTAAAMFKVGRL